MTSLIELGSYWSLICQAGLVFGADERKIIVGSLMRCFGFFVQGHHGGICRPSTEGGAIHTVGLSDGETRGSGKSFLRGSWMRLITGGS